MKYMLLIYGDENALSDAEREACYADSGRLVEELAAQGKCLAAAPLQKTATATTLRVREGRRLVTDGPFAETHEQLGGYFLVDVATVEEAVAIAERLPAVQDGGTVEIRPLVELP